MTPFVALLRGVNVGGVTVLMSDLRAAAEDLGWTDAKTYAASGQMVFRADGACSDLERDLSHALATRIGRTVPILVLTPARVKAALDDCPFDPPQGSHVHVVFLWKTPEVDRQLCEDLRAGDEELVVDGDRAWLHAPSGIGRSRLAGKLGRVLTCSEMTTRNLNTVRRLAEMLDGMGASG